ncbi:MAG: hypothetical protein Fur0043_02890 [Anaerolineales bacterium]
MPRLSSKNIPLALFLLTLLSYGTMLPWTGFYWDDWPFAWIAKFLGPAEFMPAFAPFRPFLGPIFFGTTSLLPPNPLWWQSLALLLRFGLALSAWWMFKTIWPEARWQTLVAALFFLVFPGYSQHWVAYTHINQEWIPFFFYLLSFGFTAQAIRNPARFERYTLLALLFLVPGVFPTEYFATQEPLRLLFLWALLPNEGFLLRLQRAVKAWLPYLLVWLSNAAWLVYYYKFGGYASYSVTTESPVAFSENPLLNLLWTMGDAIWKAGVYSWVQILPLATRSLSNPSTHMALAGIALGFALLATWLGRLDLPGQEKNLPWGWQAVMFGLIGILLGRVPSWAAGLPLTLQSVNDRFMVSMMLGGSLFTAGVLELVSGGRRWRVYALALLLALGIGQQVYTANDFRRDWARQREIFWQFAWRIPALEPGTLVLTHELPLNYETDMGLTAPLNWVYAPDYAHGDLPYALLYTRTRLGGASLPTLEIGTPVSFDFRTVKFNGSTAHVVTVLVPPNACLRVLDSRYAGGETYERQPRYLREAIPLSNPALIRTDAPPPAMPVALFGQEPLHTWCYYYEKAELARQKGEWERVASLGDQARTQSLVPGDALEWLPFIEAYTLTGNLDVAREISLLAYQDDSRPRKGLCYTWQRIAQENQSQADIEALASEMLINFRCARE